MSSNPRYADGSARRKLRARLKSEGRGCWICRAFGRPDAINYDLPAGNPRAFEVDELIPVSQYRKGNYASKTACALDYGNLEAAHRCCNQWRGSKSVDEVVRLGREFRKKTPPYPNPGSYRPPNKSAGGLWGVCRAS